MKASLQMGEISVTCIQNKCKLPNFPLCNVSEEQSVTLHKICMICYYNGWDEICAGPPPLHCFQPMVLNHCSKSRNAAPKHPLCGPQQSFNKTSNILCNRLRSAMKKSQDGFDSLHRQFENHCFNHLYHFYRGPVSKN